MDIKDKMLGRTIFVHSSYLNEREAAVNGVKASNERLEFVGDSILATAISLMLYDAHPEMNEGELTRLRSKLVNTEALAELATSLGLGERLLLGRGEQVSGGAKNPTILAGVFEAYIAAIGIEHGFQRVHEYIKELFGPLLAGIAGSPGHFDYKPQLQELTQRLFKCSPTYRVKLESGEPHKKSFEVEAIVNNVAYGAGTGATKKKAEQMAAKNAIDALIQKYGNI